MNFNDVIAQSHTKPTIVQFTAEWCGPCRIMKPAIKKVGETREDVGVVFVDVDRDVGPSTLIEYRIMGVPTVMLFTGGKPVSKYRGYPSDSGINKWLDLILVQQD